MSRNNNLTTQLKSTLARESKKFHKSRLQNSTLGKQLEELGISKKSSYSLPLKDTLGKTFTQNSTTSSCGI